MLVYGGTIQQDVNQAEEPFGDPCYTEAPQELVETYTALFNEVTELEQLLQILMEMADVNLNFVGGDSLHVWMSAKQHGVIVELSLIPDITALDESLMYFGERLITRSSGLRDNAVRLLREAKS